MKKRARILVSLLMISGLLTVASKSYASYSERLASVSCAMFTSHTAGAMLTYTIKRVSETEAMERLLVANRFYKIGNTGLQAAKVLGKIDRNKLTTYSEETLNAVLVAGGITNAICMLLGGMSSAYAAEIVESPALALENDEAFRLLAASVGVEKAFLVVTQIAEEEVPAIVVNSLASMLEKNSNIEEDIFPDSGNEEDIEAQ